MSSFQVKQKSSVFNPASLDFLKFIEPILAKFKNSNISLPDDLENLSRVNHKNLPNIFFSSMNIVGWVTTSWTTTNNEVI